MGGMETNPVSILIIEEHPLMRESLYTAISEEPDLKIVEPSPGDENAFKLTISSQHDVLFLVHKPDIVLFSLGNPGLGVHLPVNPMISAWVFWDEGGLKVEPLRWKSSADIIGFTGANATFIFPREKTRLNRGDIVEVMLLPDFFFRQRQTE